MPTGTSPATQSPNRKQLQKHSRATVHSVPRRSYFTALKPGSFWVLANIIQLSSMKVSKFLLTRFILFSHKEARFAPAKVQPCKAGNLAVPPPKLARGSREGLLGTGHLRGCTVRWAEMQRKPGSRSLRKEPERATQPSDKRHVSSCLFRINGAHTEAAAQTTGSPRFNMRIAPHAA